MIEKLKQIYKAFFVKLGVNEAEATDYAEESSIRMVVLFTDKLLKDKLDEASLKVKESEYENFYLGGNYAAINEDIKKYMDENSSKLLFDSFMEVINDVVKDLKTGGALDDAKLKEVYAGLKTDLTNMVTVDKMSQAPTNQGSLQAIVS